MSGIKILKTLALLLILLLPTGCSKTVYVPVETVSARSDTVREIIRVLVADSTRSDRDTRIISRDSVAPVLDSLGRVIAFERWHSRETVRTVTTESTRLLALVDSLREARADTVTKEIPRPVEVVKEVPRKRATWESLLMTVGTLALAILCFWLFCFIIDRVKK